jgi:hypothetical protein
VPSKIRCDKAIVVSSGLPIVLVNRPLPLSRRHRQIRNEHGRRSSDDELTDP